ncbi:unnamed protein product [Ilex paraguariensis]|uniref:Calmodulin-binding domain-containing protein n=1 Tax=Ilex paraguariensis TaxID=185542 RepID=A0ABC8T7D0_9AQUA
MAEENINSLVTPKKTTPERSSSRGNSEKPSYPTGRQKILPHYRRASIGSCHDGEKRNTAGKPNSPNGGQNIVPHYLRASTGSCHDFCKYGREHAFEVKARRPRPKRIVTPRSDEHNPPAEKKKTMVVNLKPSPGFKTHSPDSPEIVKQKILLPSKKNDVSLKRDSSNEKMAENVKKANNLSAKRATIISVTAPSSHPNSSGSNGRTKSDTKIGKKMGTAKVSVLAPPIGSLSPRPRVNGVVSLNARKQRSMALVSPLKDQNRIRNSKPKQSNNDKVLEKTLDVTEVASENKFLGGIEDEVIIPLCPSPSASPPPSFPSSNSSSHPNSPSLSSHDEEDQKESEYSDSEADDLVSENDKSVSMDEVEILEGNQVVPRKSGEVLSEDNDSAPVKLRFRRGKVVDLQSENNGPRRLRFRRGRLLVENQDSNGEPRKRRFKKRVDDGTDGTKSSSEQVTLRHQDVAGRKDAQGLFNNVIEETASKLVESRKSKVKALVGAFETVISLQESKPSTPTVD